MYKIRIFRGSTDPRTRKDMGSNWNYPLPPATSRQDLRNMLIEAAKNTSRLEEDNMSAPKKAKLKKKKRKKALRSKLKKFMLGLSK